MCEVVYSGDGQSDQPGCQSEECAYPESPEHGPLQTVDHHYGKGADDQRERTKTTDVRHRQVQWTPHYNRGIYEECVNSEVEREIGDHTHLTAAVIPFSAAVRWVLLRSRSTYGASRKMNTNDGTNVTHVVRRAPMVAAAQGSRPPGLR